MVDESERLSRRAFIGSAGIWLGLAAVGCGTVQSSTIAQQVASNPLSRGPLHLRLDDRPGIASVGVHLADRFGYYLDEGFQSVTASGPDEGADLADTLLSGTSLIGYGELVDLLAPIQAVVPLRVIAALHPMSGLSLVQADRSQVRTLSDLDGEEFGLPASQIDRWSAILASAGLSDDGLNLRSISDESVVVSLLGGSVAGVLLDPLRWLAPLELAGAPVDYVPLSRLVDLPPGRVAVTSSAALETHRDDLVAALRAELAGWQLALSNPRLAVDVVVNHYAADRNLDEQQVASEFRALVSIMTGGSGSPEQLLAPDPSSIDRATSLLARAGFDIPPEVFAVDLLGELG